MLQLIQSEFVSSVQGVAGGVAQTLPKILIALVLIIAGWIVGAAICRVVHELVDAIKMDEWLAKAGVGTFLDKAGYKLNSGMFLGWLAKMFFIIIFVVAAFDILGLTQINIFLTEVLAYIPQVVVAAIVLFVASIAADLLSGMVTGATKAVGSHVSQMLGAMTRSAIWIFAFIIALSQLGIAAQYMYTLFAGFIAMLAIAGGLAFGLGGKEAAAGLIKSICDEIKEKK